MVFQAKPEVLQLFVRFVGNYIPIARALFATLGGEGLEASLWQRLKLRPEQGWLIECKRDRSRRLIARFPFRFCSRLESFPGIFTSVWGSHRGIDGFHLDLCGTFEASDEAFGPVVPLIAKSEGKCLAVTVADQRRNISLEDFGKVLFEANELLGAKVSEQFFGRLEGEHRRLPEVTDIGLHADPMLGAKREFAFAIRLVRLLAGNRAPRIERIERYHYVSLMPRPFRMRTYFFRFAKGKGRRFALPAYAREALSVWNKSTLVYVGEEGTVTVSSERRSMATESGKSAPQYKQLETLVRAAGGECLKEFESLMREASLGRRVKEAINDSGREPHMPAASPVRTELPKNGRQILLQISLMRAMAEGRKAYDDAVKDARRTHGFKGKGANRTLGALYARTQGKFRGCFVGRVIAQLGDDVPSILEELAKLYSKLGKAEVTVEMLRQEATATA